MQMSNYRQLFVLSSKVLSTYDPDSSGVDTHLGNFLQLPECSVSTHMHIMKCMSAYCNLYMHTECNISAYVHIIYIHAHVPACR